MIQLVSDNFTRANENPLSDGGNWSKPGYTANPLKVLGNVCTNTVAAYAQCGALWTGTIVETGDSWPADQYSEVTIAAFGDPGGYCDIIVRALTGATNTRAILELVVGSTQSLYMFVGGSLVATYAFSATVAVSNVWRLSVTGTTFTVTQNGVTKLTQVDSNIASGTPGLAIETNVVGTNTYSLWAGGANQAAAPTFSPNGGSFGPAQTVTITSSSGGTIFYTTDGSTPTHSSSSIASGATISVSTTSVVKAFASATNLADSTVASASFTINGAQATPTFSPVAGSYSSTQSVTITSAGADTIYYTTDGSTPTHASTVYSGPVAVAVSLTLKALAVKSGFSDSAIGSAAYTITGGGGGPKVADLLLLGIG